MPFSPAPRGALQRPVAPRGAACNDGGAAVTVVLIPDAVMPELHKPILSILILYKIYYINK